ncbi:MAG: transporter substrate-binding domain-containing protein [Treponema sp.]|jgi:PAS domain S-box-containing protein|nr:transporter substrate-binding domain-containing protein [Treponema sp.]
MQRRKSNIATTALAVIFILSLISSCGKGFKAPLESRNQSSPFASYLEIPGITAEEITAIEAFKAEGRSFSYGSLKSMEAFTLQDGSTDGFSHLFCELLSEIFGIPFVNEIHEWEVIKSRLDNKDIDFSGEITPTAERRKTYFMTHPIAERSLRIFTQEYDERFHVEEDINYMRLGSYKGSITAQFIMDAYPDLHFELVDMTDASNVAESLADGTIDIFIGDATSSVEYETYASVHSKEFFPLVYTPVSMTTANPELKPIISVVNKYLEAGGIDKLFDLYKEGRHIYAKYELEKSFTEEENAYIANLAASGSKVPIALESDNYPISFYNKNDKGFQGITTEILSEITAMTGIEFRVMTNENTSWSKILDMLSAHEVALVSQLLHTPERDGKYLWSNNYSTSHYALLSKAGFPFLDLYQVVRTKVGVIRNSAYEEMYKTWFPDNHNIVFFNTSTEGIHALESGEIDLLMASENMLITTTHYLEMPGYKVNILFNTVEDSRFGFNINEEILCSIFHKTQYFIDSDKISVFWSGRMFDYSRKLAQAQRPWLIGATVLSLLSLALMLTLFFRNRGEGKRLEKLVAEKTSTITAILDATPDLIFCKDLNSRFTECNKSMEHHFNLRKSDIIGKTDIEALGLSSDLAEQYTAIDKKVFDAKKAVIVEESIPSSDGKTLLFETIKTPLICNGEVTGLVVMSRDITQRKAMEEEARKASVKAAAASMAKSRFVANMNHEMRTPMNVIVGLTDLMMEEDDISDRIKVMLRKISSASNTLMGLINDVLDISKIEAGKIDLNPVQYDVAELLNDIIMINMIRIGDKMISFKLDISDDLPSSLFGDDLRIKQIVNNLLSNAFKYTKEGLVTFGFKCLRDDDGVWASFYVSDTGIGIREEDISKLFTDYNQVDTKVNRKIEGTGLGLSITKKFVELMGGEISVESEYGKGTTFRVRIRQGFVTDKPIGKETAENLQSLRYTDKKKQMPEKLVRTNLSYARVLVVDDFPPNLDVAIGMLRKYKMEVDCVDNGKEAVNLIASQKQIYNAIFMDHMMPEMDGIEATKLIRALGTEYAKKMPVIALTANAIAGNEQMFLDNGFNAFLAKPFSVMSLDAIVQLWVRDKSKEENHGE